jgi:hypothetical protein
METLVTGNADLVLMNSTFFNALILMDAVSIHVTRTNKQLVIGGAAIS